MMKIASSTSAAKKDKIMRYLSRIVGVDHAPAAGYFQPESDPGACDQAALRIPASR
jgi:hypothetical protein